MTVDSRKTKRLIIASVGVIAVLVFIGLQANKAVDTGPLKGKIATVYRSATCGCCANYITYLRRQGVKVDEKISDDMDAVKRQYGVPTELSSCHTTIIDGYTVEGHIPVEAIGKLLAERPALVGIALPRMPSGSPGMPGTKYGTFDIAGFVTSGSYSPYVSI